MQSVVCWFYSTVTLSSHQITCVIFICSAGSQLPCRPLKTLPDGCRTANLKSQSWNLLTMAFWIPSTHLIAANFRVSLPHRHGTMVNLHWPHRTNQKMCSPTNGVTERNMISGRQFFSLPHPPLYLSTDEKDMMTKELKVRKPKYVLLQAIVMHRFGSKHCILNVLHWELE